jgi:molecular chaperone DnaK (HSP70)
MSSHYYRGSSSNVSSTALRVVNSLYHDTSPGPVIIKPLAIAQEIDANGILQVSAADKGTGKSEMNTITEDKDQLSEEEIERMVREAEEIADQDKKVQGRIEARKKENPEAEAEEYSAKQKEVEQVANPIMQKVYQGSGAPGGSSGGDDDDFGQRALGQSAAQ